MGKSEMTLMERLGYVKKERYEHAVRERDEARNRIGELEALCSHLRSERDELESKVETLEGKVTDVAKERDELKSMVET
ncbi:MAG: hypothetical protein ACE5NN_06245, partial [Candidatus Bathyarchaeia archaeon]